MKRKEKFKSISKLYFIIPFIIIFSLFTAINIMTVTERVDDNYEILEKESLSLAKSYSLTLFNAIKAEDTTREMIENKLMIASGLLAQDANIKNNQYMTDIAEAYDLDVIFYYNNNAEVIYSSMTEFIGWTPSTNHPVNDFYTSGEKSLIEDIRESTKLQEPYQYSYYRLDNGEFIQVGIKGETIDNLIRSFEIDYLFEQMNIDDTVEELYFFDKSLTVINSTNEKSIGVRADQPEIVKFFIDDEITSAYINNNGSTKLYYVFIPVYTNDEMIGTLVITRATDYMTDIEADIIRNGKIVLTITLIILGVSTYLLYKRSQSFLDLAYYDRITNLPNDLYLRAYLKETLVDQHKKAIFLIDIENYKTINLTYGYEYGDEILKEVSKRLLNILKRTGRIFRFSQDRFVFVSDKYNEADDLVSIAKDIEEAFNEPVRQIDDHQYIHSRVAIVEIGQKDKVDAILRNASIALNHTKDRQGQYTFFKKDMSDALERANNIEKIILESLENQEKNTMYLSYQPILDTKTLKPVGFEALARIDTEFYGSLSPEEFISIAESRLLIFDVGKFLFKQAIIFLKKLDQIYPELKLDISINVSILELLRADYIEYVKKTVNEYGVSPKRIELEVTESVFEEKFDLANDILGKLRKIGFRVALDDFGTGYSSFYRLREMNMDTIKIDQYFVHKILEMKTEEFIIDEIITLSHKLNLKVVAEGVENPEEVKYLKSKNCDYLQGYFFNKPLKEEEFIESLKQFQKK